MENPEPIECTSPSIDDLNSGACPLEEHLYQYVRLEKGPGGMRVWRVNHPLVSQEIANINYCGDIHDAIEDALIKHEEDIESGNWEAVIYNHDRRHRVMAFAEYSNELGDVEYWRILGDLYRNHQMDDEEPTAHAENLLFREFFRSQRLGRENLMRHQDRAVFARLPDEFPVHRGFARGDGAGLSWTLDEAIAKWFASRECTFERARSQPRVISGIARREQCLAYFGEEHEIVIFSDDVMDKRDKECQPNTTDRPDSPHQFDLAAILRPE